MVYFSDLLLSIWLFADLYLSQLKSTNIFKVPEVTEEEEQEEEVPVIIPPKTAVVPKKKETPQAKGISFRGYSFYYRALINICICDPFCVRCVRCQYP